MDAESIKLLYGDEFERGVERLVEQCRFAYEREVREAFEANRARPCALCDVMPIIGGMRGFQYNPHASRQSHRDLEALVVQALLARKWFEYEAPLWAQPLPLTEEDCAACFNRGGDRRSSLVGNYARRLREMWWDYRLATPFEVFCAHRLAS